MTGDYLTSLAQRASNSNVARVVRPELPLVFENDGAERAVHSRHGWRSAVDEVVSEPESPSGNVHDRSEFFDTTPHATRAPAAAPSRSHPLPNKPSSDLQRLTVADPGATAKPLDKLGASKLNLFLYQVAVNAAWRNQDLPTGTQTGQPARPLLPLNLHYLISACEEDQKLAHDKLGKTMLTFHDAPQLTGFNGSSGIKNQADPIRVTTHPLNLDEMSKLWSSFQTAYRPSVAYEVSVVLIESEIASPLPLPVLHRGEDDLGWDAAAQFPARLSSARFQTLRQPGMHVGEKLTLLGENLNQPGETHVVFGHHALTAAKEVVPDRVTSAEVALTVPNAPNDWPAGVYTVSVRSTVTDSAGTRSTDSTPVYLAMLPEITVPAGGLQAAHSGVNRTLAIPCRPKLQPKQDVKLLIGSTRIESIDATDPAKPVAKWDSTKVKFIPGEAPFARLIVDGVESLLHDPAQPVIGFDPRFEVKNLP